MPAAPDNLIRFLLSNPRFLGFGFLMAFASSPGQTYLIGVFGPEIQAEFGLSHTQWGSIYMIATLASSILFLWSGKLVDSVDLRKIACIVIVGLALACVTISVAGSAVMIVIAVFMLRHFGQGLTSHAGTTSMARYFGHNRGKAIALGSIGYSVGEGILPVTVVAVILLIGWRHSYLVVGIATLALLPVALWLLKGHSIRHKEYLADREATTDGHIIVADKTRLQAIREPQFWLIMPGAIMPALTMTAMFFHHLTLAEFKNWTGTWVTGNYSVYAIASVLTSIAAGPVIDRYTAVRVMPLFMLPFIVGLVLLALGSSLLWVIPYMFLMGVSTGLYYTGIAALLTELYGTTHLGAIKSTVGSLSVFASALGPVIVGLSLDNGFNMNHVCIGFALACLASTVSLISALGEKSVEQTP